MLIQWKKGRDGPPSLACVREDGTRTWRRVHTFFPLHDMEHCVVESVLAFDRAFFGLVASGWAIEDFEKPGTSARLTDDAMWAEHIVGVLDLERGRSEFLTAAEFNDALSSTLARQGCAPFRAVTVEELQRIHESVGELASRWTDLPAGAMLEVEFPLPARPGVAPHGRAVR